MKKIIIMSLGAGALLLSSCDGNRTENTETATLNETSTTTAGGMEGNEANYDAMYRDRASATSTRLGTDLSLDENTRTRANDIYYNRAQRRAQMQQRYAADTTGMAGEMRTIDEDTDREFRDIMTAEQYRNYEQNRENYADRETYDMNSTGTGRTGEMGTNDMGTNNLNQGTGTNNMGTGNQPMNQGTGAGTGTQTGTTR